MHYPLLLGLIITCVPLLPTAKGQDETLFCKKSQAINSYNVYRKDKKIGTHEICFIAQDDQFLVRSETNMKVKFLFFTAYKYRYVSQENWADGMLQSVVTTVNDNGKKSNTQALKMGPVFQATNNKQSIRIDESFLTTNHWNARIAGQTHLFNTITGVLNAVQVEVLGETTEGIAYSVNGDLAINTRYDRQGNWLGMTFNHKDGSRIEFRCIDCKNTPEFHS